MRILLLGGGGFLGQKLAAALLQQGYLPDKEQTKREITRLVLFDRAFPRSMPDDPRLERVEGDLCDEALINTLLGEGPDVIYHLAAIVSGEAERNFDLGMRVNLQASLYLLERCRQLEINPVLVFASSVAVFSGDLTPVIRDDTASVPMSSYGAQKAIVDLLINDYSRRGFIDGRALRLPTIIVRPGKPNAATSSFASSIIREPLQGQRAVCPVGRDTRIWVLSPRQVVQSFIHAAGLPAAALGNNRIINLPGLTTSVGEIVAALEEMAGKETSRLIDWEPDPFIRRIVLTWPPQFIAERGLQLGFTADASIREIIGVFVEEELS